MKYTGNVLPEIAKEEHDQILNAKRMSLVSSATIYAVVNTAASGQASVVIDGSLPAGTNNIGDVDIASALPAGDNNIGNVDIASAIPAGSNNIGDVDVASIAAGTNYIGLASVNIGGSLPSINGEVEAVTSQTINTVAIAANSSGYATIFVPTNTFKVTHLLLSANATVGVRILSGATYLTGNASLNMTLFPGGGFVENGQILNPVYTGATAADAFVLDLDDSVEIAGKVVYFEE